MKKLITIISTAIITMIMLTLSVSADRVNTKYVADENGKTDFTISKRDLQIIYSSLQEYDMNTLSTLGYDLHPDNFFSNGVVTGNDLVAGCACPHFVYETTYTANGVKYSQQGCDSTFERFNREKMQTYKNIINSKSL